MSDEIIKTNEDECGGPAGPGYAHLSPNMNVTGVGPIVSPTNTSFGSGDFGCPPKGMKSKKKRKKRRFVKDFDSFVRIGI